MTKHTVIIIEDEPAIREMMQQILENAGYEVSTAAEGAAGLAQLRASTLKPCVILLDIMMPGVNGWDFLDAQRGDPSISHIPVVICSAYRESAKAIHPAAFLEKPVQKEALLSAVKSLCP